jgi:hypothetical protein
MAWAYPKTPDITLFVRLWTASPNAGNSAHTRSSNFPGNQHSVHVFAADD